MQTILDRGADLFSTEQVLLALLKQQGPQTLESLCALPDIGSAQVLLAVDKLSRSGAVSIEPLARCEYRVSLIGAER
jgi:hypothetical protein